MGFRVSNNGERGASILEFALVLPILLVLVFGVIEFGIIFYDKAMLTNAVREGARYGIVSTSSLPANQRRTKAEISEVVTNYCSNYLITFGAAVIPGVDVVPDPSGAPVCGDDLTVSVTYYYDFLLIPNFLPGLSQAGLDLSANVMMRYE